MGDKGKPSACESDVTGAVSMLTAYLAADAAPALMDWNNNIREERDTCVSLHCSISLRASLIPTLRSNAWMY